MKNIYWIKKEVWCKFPFQDEIDHRYIEFYTKVRHNYKNKLPFTCDSSVVNDDRLNFVAQQLNMNPKHIKLISIVGHNKSKHNSKLLNK